MKKTVLLIAISMILQSCFSYKAVENNACQYQIGKHYKIQHDNKTKKVTIVSKTDSLLVVKHKFQEEAIGIDSIEKVQKRKFSYLKTLILPPVTFALLIGILASGVKVKTGGISSPP